jgi:hypothetical protein
MQISIHWIGISTKFRQVHSCELQTWLAKFCIGDAPEWYRIAPRKPLGRVVMGPLQTDQCPVKIVEFIVQEDCLYDRTGLVGKRLIVTPSEWSRLVLDEWECEMCRIGVLGIPVFGNVSESFGATI